MKFLDAVRSSGPAVIVAAVVLGPGSILTSSKVGASYGFGALAIVAMAGFLMFGMVSLASRLGVTYKSSLCSELTTRLGRWVAIVVGCIVFTLIALFQQSNNVAMIGGMEALTSADADSSWLSGFESKVIFLVGLNTIIIATFYASRNLYRRVERLMKVLVLLFILAFAANFLAVLFAPMASPASPENEAAPASIIALMGFIGTTFSVAGAFYQAYLVKEKGWTLADWEKGRADAKIGAIVLVGATALILATSAHVFYGRGPVLFGSVADVAMQLEPLFGSWARIIFALGILAGAVSSFLVNAIIGGTILADSFGKGSRLQDMWPRHLTALALVIGLTVALATLASEDNTVKLITFAQALTVLGLPALAAALVYLGTRPDLEGEKRPPRWMINTAWTGLTVALVLAGLMAYKLASK